MILSRTGLPTVFIPLVILLWRKFISEEIGEFNVNKSGNRLYIYAPMMISSLAGVKIKCNTPHPPTSYFRNNMPFFSERALGRSSVHAALRQGAQRTQGRGKAGRKKRKRQNKSRRERTLRDYNLLGSSFGN
jgi:hypothetical protein